MTSLRQCLQSKQFVCVLESLPNATSQYADQLNDLIGRGTLAGMPIVASLADRVSSDAPEPIAACQQLEQPHLGLMHFSGKARCEADLIKQLKEMDKLGIEQLLLLSGDRLPGHQPGQSTVRYLESVCSLLIARQRYPKWLLGAALNPFKYCEEDGAAQYLKGQKKLLAGADFLTLQLGFDPAKQLEALNWMKQQANPKPMLACVMAINASRVPFLKQVPGVVVSPALEHLLEQERATSHQQAQKLSVQRLALHILGLKLMGFAGIHLSGIHTQQSLFDLETALLDWQLRIDSLPAWQQTWAKLWQDQTGQSVSFQPPQHHWQMGQSTVEASLIEQLRYRALDSLHKSVFTQDTLLGKAVGWALTRPIWQQSRAANSLHFLERAIKRPIVGCDTCGACRLDKTLYVCPETCPKGLANGPCGGTQLNRCEFADRECIHSVKYRIGKTAKQLPVLADQLIPCVQESTRGTSSWSRWYND